MKTKKFDIVGMTCSACAVHVENAAKKVEGITAVNVNLLSNSMSVSGNNFSSSDVETAVKSAGYTAVESGKSVSSSQQNDNAKTTKLRLIWSFIFLIPLFYISMGHMMNLPLPDILLGEENALTFGFLQFLLVLPIMFLNIKYFTNGFKSLFKGAPNMDTLIAIGSTAAILYGVYAIFEIGYGLGHADIHKVHRYAMDLYFESAGMILTLITLGKYFEEKAKGKTTDAIAKLLDLSPKTALIERDNSQIEIPASEVSKGDIVIVKSGATIPVDGEIVFGNTSVDQSAITGESIAVEKNVGDKVTGGTINKLGYIKFKATSVGEETVLSQIIKLVENASSSKAPIARLADKVSGIFVPLVIAVAVIATLVWILLGQSFEFAISIGIAVLVISCPCALGLATPTAIMVGTGKGAQNGILIKSAQALETLHSIDVVVLDKTGTITNGTPVVTDILPNEISVQELLQIAFALENSSEHPLANAITDYAKDKVTKTVILTDFVSTVGKGVQGKINGEKYLAGNEKFLFESEIKIPKNSLASEGKTPLYFASSKKFLGTIAVMDTVKPTSKQAIDAFKKLSIKTIMLTGDNKITANAIKNQLDIDEVTAEIMPADKEKTVAQLMQNGHKVLMIGDGINDSPALARADVGMAIGAGTDIAIDAADIVLMKSDLLDAVTAIKLSKATIRNIKQNLFWALIYNTIGIPVAAGVLFASFGIKLNPMIAAAAMSLSSVCVVLNALRLKFFKADKPSTCIVSTCGVKIVEKEENISMKKIIKITGMSCGHCSARVSSALNEIDGVTATVSHETAQAEVTLSTEISDEILINAVKNAGYEATQIIPQ